MSHVNTNAKARLLVPLTLVVALAACSGKDETATPAAPTAAAPAAAPAATPAPAPAVSAKVQSMGTEELRELASKALRENRMYAPAGDNAMEYYLALREKTPDDASIKSALTDLQPYVLIAAEQSLAREDFTEGQRLVALIEKVDPNAAALPRLKTGITKGTEIALKRTQEETDKVKKDAENKTKQLADQQRQQQASEAEAAKQIAAQQDAARRESERQDGERQAAARREAEQRQQAAAAAQAAAARAPAAAPAAAATLRPISTPAPRYPADALRSGTSGEVLVEITVGTDGSVTNARVLRATPARIFDREALGAVKKWKFEPVAAPTTTRRTLAFAPGG
ncbi:energy transducer TonB [uncultured Stenotrophomonas sp.]|uniref:energy transducer TonB n=1 Tax=uncultured Stenotrophomonas sp. TaxID=165438 RepID=UPI0028EA2938|nr:energy transducer TonB [uncultured Stenotrophomonas sp.]